MDLNICCLSNKTAHKTVSNQERLHPKCVPHACVNKISSLGWSSIVVCTQNRRSFQKAIISYLKKEFNEKYASYFHILFSFGFFFLYVCEIDDIQS